MISTSWVITNEYEFSEWHEYPKIKISFVLLVVFDAIRDFFTAVISSDSLTRSLPSGKIHPLSALYPSPGTLYMKGLAKNESITSERRVQTRPCR